MKVLSLRQPWATLLVIGAKQYETRSWRTSYRGPLLIHASRTLSGSDRRLCLLEPYRAALLCSGVHAPDELPLGAIIGACELVDCVPAESLSGLGQGELAFGNFAPGRFAWVIADRRPVDPPVETRGRLGLWEFPL